MKLNRGRNSVAALAALTLLGLVTSAHASPITYQFNVQLTAECLYSTSGSQMCSPTPGAFVLSLTYNDAIDPAYQREYEQHYSRINVWMRRAGVQWEGGRVYSGQSICSDAEVERSEYYNDYLRRLDLFHACGATIRKDAQTVSAIFSLRPRRMGAWGRELDDLFQPLLPHLQRAVELHRRLSSLSERLTAQRIQGQPPSRSTSLP